MTNASGNEAPAAEEAVAIIPAEPPPVLRVRNVWLVILTLLATLYVLRWAAPILIPVIVGVMTSYALSPLVNAMEKLHIPRAIGAALLLLSVVGGIGWLTYSLGDETVGIIEKLPEAAQKMRSALRAEPSGGTSTIDKVQKAASELEKATGDSGTGTAPRGVMRVQIEKPKVNINEFLWSGTVGMLTFIGQVITVIFFAYFLLAAGDSFRRRLIKISGTRLSEKKVTVVMLNEITQQIQRYLMVQIFTSIVVGVVSWLAFAAVGLENAAVWGIAAGVLNSVPYFGPLVVSGGIALVAVVQFGTLSMALWVASIALLITSVEGYLLTPWLLGRTGRINVVVVFASVLLGGWLWGAWGLLLGVPVVMVIKAVCDRVEDFKPVGELLGD